MRFCLSALSIILSLFCSSGAAEEDMSSAFVSAQNTWREKVGVPPLTWSPELAEFARQWADHLKETNGCKMKHRGSGGNPSERRMNGQVTGENLSWRWSSRAPAHGYLLTPQEAVDMWGNEEVFYDHATGHCKGGVCGHYTQLVWRNSQEVGCAVASCGKSEVWVCNYLPAGNYVGEKSY